MANNLIRVRREFAVPLAEEPKIFTRIDDPELVIDAAASRERNNVAAVRMGLPAVGAKLVNRYGLEFEVESHVHVPTANTVQRWRKVANPTPTCTPVSFLKISVISLQVLFQQLIAAQPRR